MASQIFAAHRSCTWRCRSQQHAGQLASAITKSSASISDEQLKVYLALTCPNGVRSTDIVGGRTLVHWAASCGDRNELLEWLLDEFGAEIDAKDLESGYTPLHRALLHGQLASAQVLIDRDAALNMLDREGLTPLDIVRRDQGIGRQGFSRPGVVPGGQEDAPEWFSLKVPTEVYSCGENVTSNLGHRVPKERAIPELVDYFSHRGLSMVKVAMSKWHTAFLTTDGAVYTCGHGSFGRLGHGDSNVRTVPTQVHIPNEIRNVAVGDEHTVVVTANGSAWAWGGNRHRQLGLLTTADSVSTPQLITLGKNVKDHTFLGCAASNSYTVLWTSEFIYGCGANDGQFGRCALKTDADVYPLRQLVGVAAPFVGTDLLDLTCGEMAIAILTKKFDVFLLHNFESRRILSRLLNFTHIVMNPGGTKKPERQQQQQQQHQHQVYSPQLVRLILFSHGGFVYYWDTKDQHLRSCAFKGSVTKTVYPRSACAFGDDGLFLVTDDGKLHKGQIKDFAASSAIDTAVDEPEKSGGPSKTSASVKDEKHPPKKGSSTKSPIAPEKKGFGEGKPSSKKAAATDFKWTSSKALATKAAAGYYNCRENASPLDPVEHQTVILSGPIQGVHRAIMAAATSDGRNFCIIQQNPKADLIEVPTKTAGTMSAEYATLLDESDVSDCLHDFQVRTSENGAQFRAVHKFILCSRCPYFSKRIQPSTMQLQIDEPAHVVTESALNRILEYIYTDDCDLFHEGPLSPSNNRNDGFEHVGNGDTMEKSTKGRDPVRELLEASKRLNMKALTKRLETLKWDSSTKTVVQAARYHHGPLRLRFEPNAFPELCDVRLQCKDGVFISNHRCVLSARSEYFRCMFASGWWSETDRNQTLKVDVDSQTLTPVLFYLYTDELPVYTTLKNEAGTERSSSGGGDKYATADKDMLEHYGKILVCADQWLLDRLRQLCEIELAARVTLRNVADMLEFARAINADQLFATCAQFISLNLCALLDANALRNMSTDCLRRVGEYYRNFYPHVGHRAVTPSCDFPNVGDIEYVWNDVMKLGISPDELLLEYLTAWTQFQTVGDSPTASAKKKRPGINLTPRQRRTSATASISENIPEESATVAKTSDFGPSVSTPLAASKAINAIPVQEQKGAWLKNGRGKDVVALVSQAVKSVVASEPIAVPASKVPMRSRNKPWNVALSPTEAFPEVSLRDLMQAEEKKEASMIRERRKSSAAMVMRQAPSPSDQKSPVAAWTSTSPPPFIASLKSVHPLSPQQPTMQLAAATVPKKQSTKAEGNRAFNEIIMEERSKEAARTRILNKPLKVIQDEELAMQELALIYQVDDNWDELITVERAVAVVSEPTWQAHIGSPPRF